VKQKINHFKPVFFALLISAGISGGYAAEEIKSNEPPSVFATIGKVNISWQDFEAEYKKEAKNKFFHGKPADHVIAELQRTVSDKLITNALVLNEANRRKLKPDAKILKQKIADFELRFANDPTWVDARSRVLPTITERFKNEDLVATLERNVRKIAAPTAAQSKAFYANHPEKFTAPLEQRVSVILLSVDPSSDADTWAETTKDAKVLIQKIHDGADFAEVAKQYSKDDATVDQGGDMGYLHEGMLPGLPQETVNKLEVGGISEPVQLLEGVGIFRLAERKPSTLSEFESVKQRVQELWLAEQSDLAWANLLANLKKNTPMRIDESKFIPLAVVKSTSDIGVTQAK
jgi:parvulin-like peptidyl-prolyl isomerase